MSVLDPTDLLDEFAGRRIIGWLVGQRLCGCNEVADCGLECRRCVVVSRERRVDLLDHAHQSQRWMAEEIVRLEETRAYLGAIFGADRRWCRSRGCGHAQMVHLHGGCSGLSGDDVNGWSRCGCGGWRGDES